MAKLDIDIERYARQLVLPEISLGQQERLGDMRVLIIGAGGLGCPALPYLASAGIGHITIYDHDTVSRSNLHRQTLYKDVEVGQNKATLAAQYAQSLNPDITVTAQCEKLTTDTNIDAFDLLIDGSDNFETKTLLNTLSIKHQIPLVSASVNQWQGQVMLLGGFAIDAPCYHCLFPDLPSDARNCNEAGILGTAAGITGVYQAHLALCHLLGLDDITPGTLLTFDYKTMRMQKLNIPKNAGCSHCANQTADWPNYKEKTKMPELISMKNLAEKDHVIVDVRTAEEIIADPIQDALHMELSTIPARHEDLPKDTLLAFVCAGNIRSVQAAEYLAGLGYDNVCVLDKFSV